MWHLIVASRQLLVLLSHENNLPAHDYLNLSTTCCCPTTPLSVSTLLTLAASFSGSLDSNPQLQHQNDGTIT